MESSVVERFKKWLIEDGRADSTVQSYIKDVNKFNRYLVERDAALEVLLSRFYFTSYLKQLQKDGVKINTINKKMTKSESL